jgi:[NiFe] hydrogenase large subunit
MFEFDSTINSVSKTISIITDINTLKVPEGGQAAFNVSLSNQPQRPLTVYLALVSGGSFFEIDTTRVKFDGKNWSIGQRITVRSIIDNNQENDTGTISLTGKGIDSKTIYLTQLDQTEPVKQTKIIIDPVSRIEGHLKIETQLDNGRVTNAWSTATLFRGIELILKGRDPRDAPLVTQRLCGVCTYIHMLTSSRCLEDAFGINIPDNARIVRNLLLGAQYVHDHIVHFYNLHGMDWVDIVSALDANPYETENLVRDISPSADPIDFGAVRDRLQTFLNSGQLGPFKNAYWGHEAYRFSPEENLMFAAHYIDALRKQAEIARLHAILGGKNPHPHGVVPGGVTCAGELGKKDRLNLFRNIMNAAKHFIDTVYLPDVKTLASVYRDWTNTGRFDNLMSFGEFPIGFVEPDDFFLPRGIIFNRNLDQIETVNMENISEHIAHSWYEGDNALHPYDGQTVPLHNGHDPEDRYSWLKAPRYDGSPMEVGPLARVMIAYGNKHMEISDAVDDFLSGVGLSIDDMFSTLGRTAARAIETQVISDAMFGWLDELENNLQRGDDQVYQKFTRPAETQGMGMNEAPRGALGHWIKTQNGKISNYQMVVPTTWNFGPRCLHNIPGPIEQALVGTPVADPSQPLELLRVIHSFDPCIACGVHVIDIKNNEVYKINVY